VPTNLQKVLGPAPRSGAALAAAALVSLPVVSQLHHLARK
jgi:hypothetical protein